MKIKLPTAVQIGTGEVADPAGADPVDPVEPAVPPPVAAEPSFWEPAPAVIGQVLPMYFGRRGIAVRLGADQPVPLPVLPAGT